MARPPDPNPRTVLLETEDPSVQGRYCPMQTILSVRRTQAVPSCVRQALQKAGRLEFPLPRSGGVAIAFEEASQP